MAREPPEEYDRPLDQAYQGHPAMEHHPNDPTCVQESHSSRKLQISSAIAVVVLEEELSRAREIISLANLGKFMLFQGMEINLHIRIYLWLKNPNIPFCQFRDMIRQILG